MRRLMVRTLWISWWFLRWVVIVPIERRWLLWRPSVTLATWAYRRGHRGLYRRVCAWWRFSACVRLAMSRASVAVYMFTLPIRPRCLEHGEPLLSGGVCWQCAFRSAQHQQLLEQLREGRNR